MSFYEKIWITSQEIIHLKEQIKKVINSENIGLEIKFKAMAELELLEEIINKNISHWKFSEEI